MRKINSNKKRGFTLIETMIYIAIFALIMTGTIISIYGILGTSARNQMKAMVLQEGTFLIGKIEWGLNGASEVEVSEDGLTLTIDKTTGEREIISVLSSGEMNKNKNNTTSRLNNTNTEVTCTPPEPLVGCFSYKESVGEGINTKSLLVIFTINSKTSGGLPYKEEFQTVKYLRK